MSRGKILGDGQYKIGEVLGEGAFSRVYRCYALRTHTHHAVKVINMTELSERDELKDALCREINSMELVSAKKSSNVVNMVDKLQSTRNYYIVMDLADGGTLMDLIHNSYQGMSHCRVWNYFVQIVHGLEIIHSANVVHRDIKPENILLATSSKETVKISDFGFACFSPKDRALFRSCGTLKYTAPEVLDDGGYDGRAVDVWSLGVTLYVMLFNCVPFYSATNDVHELKDKIRAGRYTLPRRIPRALAHLLSVMLRPNPKKRWTLDKIRRHVWFVSPDGAIGPHPPIWSEAWSSANTTAASSPTMKDAASINALPAAADRPVTPQTPSTPSAAFLVDPRRCRRSSDKRAASFDPDGDSGEDDILTLNSNASSSFVDSRRLRRCGSCPVMPSANLELGDGVHHHHNLGKNHSNDGMHFCPGNTIRTEIAAARALIGIDDLSVTELRRMSSPSTTTPSTDRSPSQNDSTPTFLSRSTPQLPVNDGSPASYTTPCDCHSAVSGVVPTLSPATGVDLTRFEKKPLLKRLSIVHILICINFFFIFAALIITGALRVLFDVDATKWRMPKRLKELMERLLTPPTEQRDGRFNASHLAAFSNPVSPRGTPKKVPIPPVGGGIKSSRPPPNQPGDGPAKESAGDVAKQKIGGAASSAMKAVPTAGTPSSVVEAIVATPTGGRNQAVLRHRKNLARIVIPTEGVAMTVVRQPTPPTGTSPKLPSPPRIVHTPSPKKRTATGRAFSPPSHIAAAQQGFIIGTHPLMDDEMLSQASADSSETAEMNAGEDSCVAALPSMRRVDSTKSNALDDLDLICGDDSDD
jgi:serine/threonine protein kinase